MTHRHPLRAAGSIAALALFAAPLASADPVHANIASRSADDPTSATIRAPNDFNVLDYVDEETTSTIDVRAIFDPIPIPPPPIPSSLATRLTPHGLAAYEILSVATMFAPWLSGYEAILPDEVTSWQTLMKEEAAAEAFRTLARNPNAAARAYALCGVYLTDRAAFAALAEAAIRETPTLQMTSGCMVTTEEMAALIGGPGSPKSKSGRSLWEGILSPELSNPDFSSFYSATPVPTPSPTASPWM